MKKTHTSRGQAGFTLIEVMIAVSLFVLVITGTMSVYIMCQKSWHSTSLHMDATRNASMAVSRLVYGVGTNSGLRECADLACDTDMTGFYATGTPYPPPANSYGHSLNPATPGAGDGSWRLTATNYASQTIWVDYNRIASNIVLWADTTNGASRLLICNYVSHAEAIPTNNGVTLTVAVRQSRGYMSHTITNTTFVKLRN